MNKCKTFIDIQPLSVIKCNQKGGCRSLRRSFPILILSQEIRRSVA